MTPGPGPIRLGVICDYLEERWSSMDLVAEMVLDHLGRRPAGEVRAEAIRPAWRGRLGRLPRVGRSGLARNVDRVVNRFHEYPKHIRACVRSGRFDLFHLIDHSYAQLVAELPAGRAVVTCHDLDTFRCILDPAAEPRPRWFRALARRTLDGLRGAAAVACNSEATRADILRHGLLPAERLRVAHIAVHPSCRPDPDDDADARARAILGPPTGAPEILHVGTNIPRKRIDVLLKVFARIKDAIPAARLVKVGGRFAPEHQALAEALGVADSVVFAPYVEPAHHAVIAAIYRRAALVLMPSDSEGFGIPVAEAMACGAAMLASDLPVLREVGGSAVLYRPAGDVDAWAGAALAYLEHRRDPDGPYQAMRAEGLARAARFAWPAHVDILMQMYRDVLEGRPVARA